MNEFKEKFHDQFINEGFLEVSKDVDPLTMYERILIPKEVILENELTKEETPALFFGTNGINTGFGIFTGTCIIWINAETPKEANEFASKITEFEPIF